MTSIKEMLPLKTPRLLLRIPEKEEAHLLAAYVTENREHLRSWEPYRSEGYYFLEYWQEQLRKIRKEFYLGQSLRLSIFLKKKPESPVIGVCNFTNFLKGVFQACFLGYSIHHEYQGQGIMAEALDAAIQAVFKYYKLHRIMANYMPRNERSGKLLRKLGFTVEGYARDYLKIAGRWEDHILTSKIDSDRNTTG